MRVPVTLLLVLATGATFCAVASEVSPKEEMTFAQSAWNMPLVGFGAKTNDAYTDRHVFLTLPIWSSIGRNGRLGGDYLIVEPYTSYGDQGEVATSLGLAWRHLFSNEAASGLRKQGEAGLTEEGIYIGANVFWDMLDTRNDNRFWQLGIGAEIGSRFLELRGNYYIPLTDRELVQRNATTHSQSFTSTSSSTRIATTTSVSAQTSGQASAPFATGNQIVQDIGTLTTSATATTTATTTMTATTRTVTVRTVSELFEEGMEGWDAEIAALVPWIDPWLDVQVIGGYFSFDNQPFGPQSLGTGNVRGWKAGIEVRPVPAVLLTGMWYEDRRFTGADWTLGVQFQIPLGREWKDAFRPRRRHLVERLAEPVHRQNAAIKVGNAEERHRSTTTTSSTSTRSSTTVARVTRIVSQEPHRIVLVDDVIFVNNGGSTGTGIESGDPAGNGTAEHPVTSVFEGAVIAGVNNLATGRVWNVYTQGTGMPYIEPLTISQSMNFISNVDQIAAPNGQSFGYGVWPSITGRVSAANIPYFGMSGYEIHTITGGAALDVSNVQSVFLRHIDITNSSGSGLEVSADGTTASSVVIQTLGIRDTAGAGIDILSADSASLDITINSNSLQNLGGNGINATRNGASTLNINGTIHNNIVIIGGPLLYDQTGTPLGTFIINNVSVSAGTDH